MSSPTVVQALLQLFAAGRFEDMEARARTLLKTAGSSAILNELLGIALVAQGRHADALPSLKKAVRREPNDPQFWENLGLCQNSLQQFADAETSLRKALGLRPHAVETLTSLGSVLRSLRRPDAAEEVLRRALTLQPNHAAAQFNLANVLLDQGRFPEAEAGLRAAMASSPQDPRPAVQLGSLLIETRRFDEAAALARQIASRLDRAGPVAQGPVLDVLAGVADILARAGSPAMAADIYKRSSAFRTSAIRLTSALMAARRACDWELAEAVETEIRQSAGPRWAAEAVPPFPLTIAEAATASDQLRCAQTYARHLAAPVRPASWDPKSRPARPRIRIGYLSNDFCNHATAHLIAGVIEAHDRRQFEVFAYDYTPGSGDDYAERLRQAFDTVVPIDGLSYQAAAERVAQDACDIIIDLKGWTAGTRSAILASRPAPLQVQWLGYPASMGAPWIDYVIADPVVIPPGEEERFSEKIIRLPDTYQPNDSKRAIGRTRSRTEYGLPEDDLVFCSFNQPHKITPRIFDVWMRLLGSAPNSVLWLLRDTDAEEALRREAARRGVAPERIVFAPFVSSPEHLARIAVADLALDCFPYGSHTTAADVLWAGVPLIALKGDTFASRVSTSVLIAAGLSDVVTDSLEAYGALASRLAAEPQELAALKRRVRAVRTSTLFDTDRFARHLEAAYAAMFQRWQSGASADHLTVERRAPGGVRA